jgi:iron(III) transport system substrate-binding protein
MNRRPLLATLLLCLLGAALAQPLTIYSGRNEAFVAPVIDAFEIATGIAVEVRYGDTAPLAAQLLEEGANTPADVYLAQDAGALGALAAAGLLAPLPREVLERVEPRFRSPDGRWVGITGRARVLVADPGANDPPGSVFDLVAPGYQARVGWAPTNGSFQAFVTAMRVLYGEDVTGTWLRGMLANGVRAYANNTAIVEAVGRGEIDFGLVNHYYLYRFTSENPDFPAVNLFLPDADIGALVNVSGAAVLAATERRDEAERFVAFLLTTLAQRHFAAEVNEYPLVPEVNASPGLPPLADLATPDLDLSNLDDLETTLELLLDSGALD